MLKLSDGEIAASTSTAIEAGARYHKRDYERQFDEKKGVGLMTPLVKELCDTWEQKYPDLWRRCYPRVYQSVGEFESPRFAALNIAAALNWIDTDKTSAPLPIIHLASIAARAFDFNLPAFFVSHEFFAAISQTELPTDIRWTDAKLPYDAGLLYLPIGALRDPEGAGVNILAWLRARKGDQLRIGDRARANCGDDQFTVVAICDSESGRTYSRAVAATQTPYIVAPTVSFDAERRGVFDLPLTADDESFLSQMVAACFSVLLSISARPELLTEGKRATGKKTKRASREVWTPNLIGRNYTVKREHQGGSHSSPRLHWRRGRWNHQPIGNYRGNPDFVSASTLPRNIDGHINWEAVSDDVRAQFWKHHKHIWLEPILIEGES